MSRQSIEKARKKDDQAEDAEKTLNEKYAMKCKSAIKGTDVIKRYSRYECGGTLKLLEQLYRMNREELQIRLNRLTIGIFHLVDRLPSKTSSEIIAKQLLRASSSVRINYRCVTMAKSRKDFIYKISVVAEEADETYGWLELITDLKLVEERDIIPLMKEARELTYIFSKAVTTAKSNDRNERRQMENQTKER